MSIIKLALIQGGPHSNLPNAWVDSKKMGVKSNIPLATGMNMPKLASINKIALNAFTRNWHNLSEAAKMNIGKSGAMRSQNKFVIGHMQGNENILKSMKNNGLIIHFNKSKNVSGPATLGTRGGNSDIYNLHQLKDAVKPYESLVGTKLSPTSRKAELFNDAVVKRHEMREAHHIKKMYNSLPLEDKKIFDKLTHGNRKFIFTQRIDDKMVEASMGLSDLMHRNGMRTFNSHMDISIPIKDITDTNKVPYSKLVNPIRKMREATTEVDQIARLKKSTFSKHNMTHTNEYKHSDLYDLTNKDIKSIKKNKETQDSILF